MNGRLFVLCGIPGSGKTYFCKHNIKGEHKYVSRDEIRFQLLGEDDEYFSKEKEVYKLFVHSIEEGLAKGLDVYADATHLNPGSRAKLLNCISNAREVNAIYFNIPLGLILNQNRQRSGRAYVPEEQIEHMAESYRRPQKSEGFAHIWMVKNFDGQFVVEEME